VQEMSQKEKRIHDEYKQKIAQEEHNGKLLDMNIVSSPDRILNELEVMQAELGNTRQKYDQALQESRKLEREMAELGVIWQCVEGLGSDLRKLEQVQDHMVEQRGREEQLRKQMNELEVQYKNMQSEIDTRERKMENEIIALQSEVQGQHKTQAAIQQQKDQIESDEKELSKRLAKAKEDVRNHHQMIKQKERSILVITDKFDRAVDKMWKDAENMQRKVDENQAKLDQVADKAHSVYGLSRL